MTVIYLNNNKLGQFESNTDFKLHDQAKVLGVDCYVDSIDHQLVKGKPCKSIYFTSY